MTVKGEQLHSLEDICASLIDDLRGVLGLDARTHLDSNTKVGDIGLDSLRALEMTAILEDSYDLVVPAEYFLQNPSVGELAALVAR